MTIATKARGYLVSAVRKLGPERAYDALRAFDNHPRYNECPLDPWRYCVLARAYGPVGALEETGRLATEARYQKASVFAAAILGLTVRETIAVMRAYDGDWPPVYRDLLKYLLVKEAGKLATSRAVEPSLEAVTA